MMLTNKRIAGLDILKIVATLFVLTLHINGFFFSQNGEESYSSSVLLAYYIFEAIAYPAIHLFVMIGSWIMIEKVNPYRQISRIWSEMWVVTVLGMLIYIVILRSYPDPLGGISCLFPFLGRAYWFVTEYIILILLSPFLNRGLQLLKSDEILKIILIFGGAVSLFPTVLPMFPWIQDTSEIANFILLYIITYYIRKLEALDSQILGFLRSKRTLLIIWLSMIFICSVSTLFFQRMGIKAMYLYAYNSPIVIVEAISLFLLLYDINLKNSKFIIAIQHVQQYSLIIYMLHMHPLFKGNYTQWRLFEYVNTHSIIVYFVELFITVICIFFSGIIIGYLIRLLAGKMQFRVEMVLKHIF